jgi:hypothetical protein
LGWAKQDTEAQSNRLRGGSRAKSTGLIASYIKGQELRKSKREEIEGFLYTMSKAADLTSEAL